MKQYCQRICLPFRKTLAVLDKFRIPGRESRNQLALVKKESENPKSFVLELETGRLGRVLMENPVTGRPVASLSPQDANIGTTLQN